MMLVLDNGSTLHPELIKEAIEGNYELVVAGLLSLEWLKCDIENNFIHTVKYLFFCRLLSKGNPM